MSELLARLHRAHVERQSRFFPVETVRFLESTPMVQPQEAEIVQLLSPPEPEPIAPLPVPRFINIGAIIKHVANHFRVDANDIKAARRERRIVHPRQVAMYLAKKLTLRSLPDIGRQFGHRDHTTILHGVRKIERMIEGDADFASLVQRLRDEICPPPQAAVP